MTAVEEVRRIFASAPQSYSTFHSPAVERGGGEYAAFELVTLIWSVAWSTVSKM